MCVVCVCVCVCVCVVGGIIIVMNFFWVFFLGGGMIHKIKQHNIKMYFLHVDTA